MAKATIVKIKKVNSNGTIVYTPDNQFFVVKALDEMGFLDIENLPDNKELTIHEFAGIAVGCFELQSSFYGIRHINFTYNNITIHVTKSDPVGYIITKWENAAKAKH